MLVIRDEGRCFVFDSCVAMKFCKVGFTCLSKRSRERRRVNNFIKVTTSDIREIVVAVLDMACFGGSTLNYNIRLNQEGAVS